MKIINRRSVLLATSAAMLAFAAAVLTPTDAHAQQRGHNDMPRRDVAHDVYVHDRYPVHPVPVREYGYGAPVVMASVAVGRVYVAPVAPIVVVAPAYKYDYGGHFRR